MEQLILKSFFLHHTSGLFVITRIEMLNFDWQYAFASKNDNGKVQVFNEVLINMLRIFALQKSYSLITNSLHG